MSSELSDEHHAELERRSLATDAQMQVLLAPLIRADKSHRRIIRGLIVVVTVLCLTNLWNTYNYVRIQDNTKSLTKVSQLCEINNETRKGERELWDFILNIPPTTPQTPDQTANRVKFIALLDKLYKLRDCSL